MKIEQFLNIIDIYYGKEIENIKTEQGKMEAYLYAVKRISFELKVHRLAISKDFTIEKLAHKSNTIILDDGIEEISQDIQTERINIVAKKFVSQNLLGKRMKQYRIDHNLSQVAFSKVCDLSPVVINKLEKGYELIYRKSTIDCIEKVLCGE